MKKQRVLVLAKRTSYRALVEEQHDEQVTRLLAKGDPTVKRMRRTHEDHEETVREVKAVLEKLGAEFELFVGPRTLVEGGHDLVVTVGGDGTLLAASHNIGPDSALLGVNSAPESSVGFFCAAKKGSVEATLASALDGTLKRAQLSRMRVDLNDQCLHRRVLNEALYCHESPAATSRYILRVMQPGGAAVEEDQRSSGLWIGPAAGSTAAQRSAGGKVLPLTSPKIQVVVREPYMRFGATFKLATAMVDEGGMVVLRSKMRNAKLFLDGHHIMHDVTLGDVVTMRRSEETLTVLGLARRAG